MDICKVELERMPPLTRTIFEAHKFEGRSYREIAENFDVDVGKIGNELHGAAKKLRRALKDYLTILLLLFSQL
jgi:RNA polymerase sigma-70 factor (ECF subfamily)